MHITVSMFINFVHAMHTFLVRRDKESLKTFSNMRFEQVLRQ